MSNDTQRAPANLRGIIVGGITLGDTLADLNTTILPDGAMAYVVSDKATYRLDKDSVLPPQGGVIVQPVSGPGRWLLQPGSPLGGYTQSIQGTALLTAAAGVSPVLNTWRAIPSGTAFYSPTPINSGLWTINTASGTFEYLGPTGLLFLVTMTASVNDDNSGTPQQLEFDLTQGGALIGTTTQTQSAVSAALDGTVGFNTEFVHAILLSAANLATYQHVFRCVTAAPGVMSFKRFQVSIVQA